MLMKGLRRPSESDSSGRANDAAMKYRSWYHKYSTKHIKIYAITMPHA